MKKSLLILLVSFMALTSYAQNNNAILFTENGERFQVILNGILQNPKPETNVKMTGLPAPNYKCRILFEDKALGYLDFNLFFQDMASEVTWNIKKNKKGEYVTRWVSAIPVAEAPPPAPAQTVIVYTTTPPPVESTSTTIQQTTTTTSNGNSGNTGGGVSMNMGINMNESGGGINMNVSGMDQGAESTTTTTTTTTHTTTTTNSSTSSNIPPPVHPATPAPPTAQVIYVSGYNGPIGCPVPMNSSDFASFKQSVQSKSFEDSKLTIAKQVLNNNCLTSTQVREVMKLFTFEDTRLTFAKYAYGHTYDTGNFYKVNDAFTFESSIDELNNYINGREN